MPPPRRSHDVRPTSPASLIEEARAARSSSEQATPRTRAPLGAYANDPSAVSAAAHAAAAFAAGAAGSSSTNLTSSSRRPNKPSISSSSSAGLGGSERDYTPSASVTPSASNVHLGVRSGSRAEMYPARDTAASPVPSTCEFGVRCV